MKIKQSAKKSSLIIALICCLVFSLLTLFVFRITQDRARLIRDNYNEQIFNRLFTGLRDYNDYASVIEASPELEENIIGLAIYREDLTCAYQWGKTPETFNENILRHSHNSGNGRYTIDDKKNRSIQFIMNIARRPPPPRMQNYQGNHHGMNGMNRMNGMRQEAPPENFFFNSLSAGNYFYIDIYQPDYWRTIHLARILFPICIALLFALIFYIRNLFLKNIEYRKRIEDQKNLVVLGSAASTLAHEIKNPLLSIRLQTGILRKLFSGNADEEINIVEEEVNRISDLVYRVNDYLRDAVGNPSPLDLTVFLREIFFRLCGIHIFNDDNNENENSCLVFIDEDRARSVFENIIRNALESGGDKNNIRVSVFKNGNHIITEIKDRGKGISKENMARVFDPFFTSKSSGTGIGLSISKRFVEAAKGTITIDSKEGEGTIARIVLPEYNKE